MIVNRSCPAQREDSDNLYHEVDMELTEFETFQPILIRSCLFTGCNFLKL
jgi:hypothetical protein